MQMNLYLVLIGFGLAFILPLLITWLFLKNKKISPFALKIILSCCGIVSFIVIILLPGNSEDQATGNAISVFLGAFFAYLILAKKYLPKEAENAISSSADETKSGEILKPGQEKKEKKV
jgi:hypothetical protein